MADYSSIGGKFGIIYTCNCGWLDRAHSFPTSSRPGVGVSNLWHNIAHEKGSADTFRRQPAFVVHYRQDAVKHVAGVKLYPGAGNFYVVRRGLSNVQKQQVALAIFIEVSLNSRTARTPGWRAS